MRLKLVLACSFIVLLISCSGSKTESKEEVVNVVNTFALATQKDDFSQLADFMHPSVSKRISKTDVVNDMRRRMDNDDYRIIVSRSNVESISDVFTRGSNKYALAKIQSDISFGFKSDTSGNPGRSGELYSNYCESFKKRYGSAEVVCDDAARKISFSMVNANYVFYDDEYKKWFVLTEDKRNDIARLIPEEIRKKFSSL